MVCLANLGGGDMSNVQLNDLVDIEQITVICLGQFHSDLKEEIEFGDKDDISEVLRLVRTESGL